MNIGMGVIGGDCRRGQMSAAIVLRRGDDRGSGMPSGAASGEEGRPAQGDSDGS